MTTCTCRTRFSLLRVAEGREAVSVNALSEVEAWRDGSAAAEAYEADDDRLHCGEPLIHRLRRLARALPMSSEGGPAPNGHIPRLHLLRTRSSATPADR